MLCICVIMVGCRAGNERKTRVCKNIHVILQSPGNIRIQIPKQVSETLQASLLCASFGYDFYCQLIYWNQQAIYKNIASSDRFLQPLCQVKLLIWLSLSDSVLFLHRTASYRIWVGEQLHSENVSFSVCQPEQLYLLYSILPWKVGLISSTSYSRNK